VRLAGDVFVAVEEDLRTERRVPTHLDRHVAPVGVHQVKRVVVDERFLLLQVGDRSLRRAADLPHRRNGAGDQDQKHPGAHLVAGQVVLGDAVLALAAGAVHHRDPVGHGEGSHPAGEPPGQPDQMGVVQLLVTTAVPASPPHPEPTRRVPDREVGVEHHPVHTVVAAGQQIPVPFTESIDHPLDGRRATSPPTAPKGPRVPGEVSERG
jgi:hypothetical protein